MKKFAKFFENIDGIGDVVVINQRAKETNGQEVRLFFAPEIDGIDVVSIAFGFDDDEKGYADCDKLFAAFDEQKARDTLIPIIAKIKEQFED